MLDRLNKYSAQETADAVGDIAETIETLSTLMDRLYEKTDAKLHTRFDRLFPDGISREAAKQIYKLSHELAPPDDYDPADRNLRD